MNIRYFAFLFLSFWILSPETAVAQNPDSVKAYILEFIEPSATINLVYSTGSVSLVYEKFDPLTPATEKFIEEQKKVYAETNDPLILLSISQTYKRMNRHKESDEWGEKAVLAIESQMGKYRDSIEIVENAYLIYLDRSEFELACLTAEMMSKHHQNSQSLLLEAITYMFMGKSDLGLAKSNKGLLLYPEDANWYMLRVIYELYNKMNSYPFNSDEFVAEENRIDRSFLDEGLSNYPDSLKMEFVHGLGNFFLYAYETVMIDFYKQVDPESEIEGFQFKTEESVEKELNKYYKKFSELSKLDQLKNWHSVYYTLGMIELFRSNNKKAIEHFEKAIDLYKPKYRNGTENAYHYYDNLIFCHRILGDVNAAEKALKRKATEDINLSPVAAHYVDMSHYRSMNGDFESAQKLLDQALGIDSTEISAYSNKALLFMLDDKLDEAFELIMKADAINSDDIFNFKSMVLYQLLKKDPYKVRMLLDQLERYDPTDQFITDIKRLSETN